MKTLNNVVTASKNLVHAASSIISVSAQLVSDGTELLNSGITDAPRVAGALMASPFAAAKGYIMESEGVSEEIAEARAYKYLKQELSRTIEEAGVGSGKLLAQLLEEEDDNDVVVTTKKVAKS